MPETREGHRHVFSYELIRAFVVFFVMFVAGGLGAPIPEEVAIVAAGVWTASTPEYGPARWLILPICIAGVLIADIILYTAGRFYGTRLFQSSWMLRMVPAEKQARIRKNFDRYGVNILLFGRLLPGIRMPLFLTAGVMHLSIPRFIVADLLGAVLGNGLLFLLAFWFGDQFRDLIDHAEHEAQRIIRALLIVTAILGAAIYFAVKFFRDPVPTGDPKKLPLIGAQVAHMSEREPSAEKEGTTTADSQRMKEEVKPKPE